MFDKTVNEIDFKKYVFVAKNVLSRDHRFEIGSWDNSPWCIELAPRKGEYCAIYLRNHKSRSVNIKCTLAILTVKNEEINRIGFEKVMEPESAFGCPTFILRDEVWFNSKEWLLNNEDLRIVARIAEIDLETPSDIHSLEKRAIHNLLIPNEKYESCKTTKKKFQVVIEDFNSKEFLPDEYVESMLVTIGDETNYSKWFLRLYPMGIKDLEYETYISVYLHSHDKNQNGIELRGKISLIHDESVPLEMYFQQKFDRGAKFGYEDFFWRDHLEKVECKENKPLIIECEIEMVNRLQSQLSKDLEKLWNSRIGTDVTFKIDGRFLEAHKIFLTTRSSVFEMMFNSNMLEATENIIHITDIEFEVMEEILYYIYTDHVRRLDQYALKITIAADKYNLSDLVEKCEKYISENLTMQNTLEALQICEQIDLKILRKKAIEFTLKNIDEMVKLDTWQEIFGDMTVEDFIANFTE